MSKYMQIDIRLVPFYETPFARQFPQVANLLKRVSYGEVVEKEISLYEMADVLDSIAVNPYTPSDIRSAMSPYVARLMGIKETARGHLLARRLNDLDQELYRMEDVFEDLERSL